MQSEEASFMLMRLCSVMWSLMEVVLAMVDWEAFWEVS